MSRLKGILESNRRRFFIGREHEIACFERLLRPDDDTRVLFVVAPGGFGKSTLLAEFAARARQAGHAVARIDASDYQPVPLEIGPAISRKLAAQSGVKPAPDLLLVDGFEHMKAIETWFYSNFIPTLDASVRIVLACRTNPETQWRTAPAWIGLMRIMKLETFNRQETQHYLVNRNLDHKVADRAWQLSQGNPLILALIADVCDRFGPDAVDIPAGQDQLHALMLGLVRKGQTAAQQRAMQVAAIVRSLSKPLLGAMLPGDDADELYLWLADLSFISAAEHGLFPHNLVRDALLNEMLHRDPELLERLIRRAEAFYAKRLVPQAMIPLDETLAEIAYLSRHGKSPAQLLGLLKDEPRYADIPLAGERAQASNLVRDFQGKAQQRLFDDWHARQPEGFVVIRDRAGEMAGFVQFVEFGDLSEVETRNDNVIDACRRFVQKRGLAPGRRASLARFWLDRCCHLAISSVQASVLMLVMGQAAAADDLDFSGAIQEDDKITRMTAALAGHDIVPGAGLTLGKTPVITTLHDWSHESVAAWMVRANRKIRGMSGVVTPPAPDGEALGTAIRHALRNFTRSDRLHLNPLMKTSLSKAAPLDETGSSEALCANLIAASKSFLSSSKTARFHEILYHSYFCPKVSRIAAAEALNMAPSTYYRHLATATDLLTEILRQRLAEG